LCFALAVPALMLRFGGFEPDAIVRLLLYGMAVVAASFLLAWAAEAAQVDISGGLAIAILALIAVLPEYAVDLYYAYTAGHDPSYVQFAAANMTGSNRLLLGLGWPVVVLVALAAAKRLRHGSTRFSTSTAATDWNWVPARRRHRRVLDADYRTDPPRVRHPATGLVRVLPV
jgi:cation:H+ antiporter